MDVCFKYAIEHYEGEAIVCQFTFENAGYKSEISLSDLSSQTLAQLLYDGADSVTLHGGPSPFTINMDEKHVEFLMEIHRDGGGHIGISIPRDVAIPVMEGMYKELEQLEALHS